MNPITTTPPQSGPQPVQALDPKDWPDVSGIVTEDDTPVDNFPSLRQQTLLINSLYASYTPPDGQPFLAAANVGIFHTQHLPPIVPDFFLGLNTRIPEPHWAKQHRSYFIWVHGKFPELVLEIVSNNEGGEDDRKLREYARLGIWYYVIYDPQNFLGGGPLRVFALQRGKYEVTESQWLPELELGLTLWQGTFEDMSGTWLRWCDARGDILLTGDEKAEQQKQRAEQEKQRAERAAEQAERLRAQLRALGIEPAE